jgi:hypothetical protein
MFGNLSQKMCFTFLLVTLKRTVGESHETNIALKSYKFEISALWMSTFLPCYYQITS